MMDDHDNRPRRRAPEKSAEQLVFERKRYGIELSRTGVRNELLKATNPRHREQLEAALQHLEDQLKALNAQGPTTPA